MKEELTTQKISLQKRDKYWKKLFKMAMQAVEVILGDPELSSPVSDVVVTASINPQAIIDIVATWEPSYQKEAIATRYRYIQWEEVNRQE